MHKININNFQTLVIKNYYNQRIIINLYTNVHRKIIINITYLYKFKKYIYLFKYLYILIQIKFYLNLKLIHISIHFLINIH